MVDLKGVSGLEVGLSCSRVWTPVIGQGRPLYRDLFKEGEFSGEGQGAAQGSAQRLCAQPAAAAILGRWGTRSPWSRGVCAIFPRAHPGLKGLWALYTLRLVSQWP